MENQLFNRGDYSMVKILQKIIPIDKKPCLHKNITDMWYTDNLPAITGDYSKFHTGFCEDCKKMVYGRTGNIRIFWNYDREKNFKK